MNKTMILCTNLDGALGYKNELLYSFPNDLQRFKELTKNNIVVMGRKTYESIIERNGKPLPNRINVVLTRDKEYKNKVAHGVIVYHDLQTIINQCQSEYSNNEKTMFIIGGSEIYKQCIDWVDTIELTLVHDSNKKHDAVFDLSLLDQLDMNKKKMVDSTYDTLLEYITYTKKESTP